MCISHLSITRSVLFLSLFASIALSACSAGLEPAHTASAAAITITLPGSTSAASQDNSNARAIVSGSGFLYLQTGITAQSATLFGPYPVSPGTTITVTDIPADVYPAIAVLFVPALPASVLGPIIPAASTAEGLRQAASTALASSPDISSAASIGLVQNFTVATGKRNELSATLIPTTALAPAADGTLVLSGAAGATTRRFIRLSGLISSFGSATASDSKSMILTLSHTNANPVAVSGVGLYTSQGLVVLRESPAASLAAGMTLSRSVAWTGDDVYYAYVEFTGPSLLSLFEGHITRQCVVSYNANGGTGTVASQVVEEGLSTVLAAGGFTRDGYSFMGWSINASATTPDYAAGATFTVGSVDVTLYAVWQANVTIRAVRFNSNGGAGSIDDLTGEPGTSVILPPGGFTKDGFNFLGWASTPLATASEYSPGTEFIVRSADTTLYAVWQAIPTSWTVSYDANGGTGTIATQSGGMNEEVFLATAGFAWSGYDLIGWALTSTATTPDYPLGAPFIITGSNARLYAVWQPVIPERAVRFDANGGTGSVADLLGPAGSPVTLPSSGFTRDGYDLVGWALSSTATSYDYALSSSFTIGADDILLFAVWQPVIPERAVRFDANGGTGSVAEFYGPVNTPITLPSSGFTRDGYDFIGWAISPAATSYDYAPSSSFTIGADDALLYAVWSDTTAPNLTLASFSTQYTNTNIDVSLSLSAYEIGSGIKSITLTGAFASYSTPTVQVGASYEPVSVSGGTLTFTTPVPSTASITIHGINITTGDGTKTIQVTLTDDAGNASGSANAIITLDTVKPTLSVMLMSGTYSPSGSMLTNGATVYTLAAGQLYLSANDNTGSGILGYQGAGWNVAFSPATFQEAGPSWIQVSDNAGNYETLNFSTTLDVTVPAFGTPTDGSYETCTITITDSGSGIKGSDYELYYTGEFDTQQTDLTAISFTNPAAYDGSAITGLTYDISGGGKYRYIRISASDNVGNTVTRYIERYNQTAYTLLPQ